MRNFLRIVCWLTLFCDGCLLSCTALTNVWGNGSPYASIRFGKFEVTSLMPGGGEFISAIAIWTGFLAWGALWSLKHWRETERITQPRSGDSV